MTYDLESRIEDHIENITYKQRPVNFDENYKLLMDLFYSYYQLYRYIVQQKIEHNIIENWTLIIFESIQKYITSPSFDNLVLRIQVMETFTKFTNNILIDEKVSFLFQKEGIDEGLISNGIDSRFHAIFSKQDEKWTNVFSATHIWSRLK